MFVNMMHPLFDMDMEVAMFIPRSPGSVTLASIAEDLGFDTQAHVQQAIQRFKKNEAFHTKRLGGRHSPAGLKQTGIKTLNARKGRSVQVSHDAWPAFQKLAVAYWNKVYADNLVAGATAR